VLKGDVAATFDGETVRSTAQFTRLVRETVPGRTVKMTVTRAGKRVDLSVAPEEADSGAIWLEREGPVLKKRLGELTEKQRQLELEREFALRRRQLREVPELDLMVPEGPMRQFRYFGGSDPDVLAFTMGRGRLGVTVQDLNPELADFFGVKEGALVASVQKDTPAAKAGIKAGDVITAIDGKAVTGPDDVVEQLRGKSGEVAVTVTRDKKALSLKAVLEKTELQKPKVILRGAGA
jgi:serine protease Do